MFHPHNWSIQKKLLIGNLGVLVALLLILSFILPLLGQSCSWIALFTLGMLGSILVVVESLVLGQIITSPFRQVMGLANSDAREGILPANKGCELGFLAEQFTRYMQQMRQVGQKLDAEISYRKSAEGFLRIYKSIFDNAAEGILIADASGKILAVNGAFSTITGYEASEVVGKGPDFLRSPDGEMDFSDEVWRPMETDGSWSGEASCRKKEGRVVPIVLTINTIANDRRQPTHFFAFFHEIAELKKREKQISFMAYHDILTRLPNRANLLMQLDRAVPRAEQEGGMLALCYIDLDNFKNVNEAFGIAQGDALLIQVAHRLQSIIGSQHGLFRLGGDEFILLMERIENTSSVYLMANRVLNLLRKPFILDFKRIHIKASIGVAVFPGDGGNGMDLIRNADMALFRAKKEGRDRFVLFSPEMHREIYERYRIENGIHHGLRNREFCVHYQPKVSIATGRPLALEALVRWEKGGKTISPGHFIPIAEESSLIDDLCVFVLEETCAFIQRLKTQQLEVPVSVNISPRQFTQGDFVDLVDDLLLRYQLEPSDLEIEITETTAMHNVEHSLAVMEQLRKRGIHFSIDDFGTGYSSLNYLGRMPVSTLKIDKRFVGDLEGHGGIVTTIIAISQQMQLQVVAEGVETVEQLRWLGQKGCQQAQGYFFSRPVAEKAIVAYLQNSRQGAPPEITWI